MRRIRLFLVWVFMAAIPLQGFAAASMIFCHGAAVAAAADSVASAQPHVHPYEVQVRGEEGHRGHSSHAVLHADPNLSQADPATTNSLIGVQPDAGHKCGVCASCSHAVAISAAAAPVHFAMTPSFHGVEPVVQMYSRASPVPDKPPRG
ncbi:MAG: hypothetical protein Q8N17_08840 [Burkholderiaceae bacterium]|nr:hypothetical protein [Burkholderiaceae bacterium]